MDSPTAIDGRRRALFLTRGGFSHINSQVRTALQAMRPDVEIVPFDVTGALLRDKAAMARCLAGVLREYGPSSLRSQRTLRYRFLRSRAYIREVRRILDRRFGGWTFEFTIQTQSLFNGARGDCPHFIYTDHAARARDNGDDHEKVGRPSEDWLELEGEIYRAATHVFTFGPNIRQLLIDAYAIPPQNVSAIGAGASVMPKRPVDTSIERYARRNILFVGVEWERKGGPELVAAFEAVKRALPDATLTIVGCRPEIAVEGCRALGRLPPEEVEQHFHAASCFCMPSRLEPFGIVFTEAMQFGLPVVATDVGGIGALVRPGQTGILVPPADGAALARALIDLLASPQRCRELGLRGLARAELFTWQAVVGRMLPHLPGGQVSSTTAGAPW